MDFPSIVNSLIFLADFLMPDNEYNSIIDFESSLQANQMQVCHVKLMIDGSARISSSGFGGFDRLLLLVV
jgi:hypothetical protein